MTPMGNLVSLSRLTSDVWSRVRYQVVIRNVNCGVIMGVIIMINHILAVACVQYLTLECVIVRVQVLLTCYLLNRSTAGPAPLRHIRYGFANRRQKQNPKRKCERTGNGSTAPQIRNAIRRTTTRREGAGEGPIIRYSCMDRISL